MTYSDLYSPCFLSSVHDISLGNGEDSFLENSSSPQVLFHQDPQENLEEDIFSHGLLRQEIPWKKDTIVLETGAIAREAQGSILVSYGHLRLLCTLCFKKKPEDYKGFLPLSLTYQERSYAVGKIPSGFHRREGKGGDQEILMARLLDRTFRPLFPKGFCHDTQIIVTLLSDDHGCQGDLPLLASLGILGCLLQSGLPLKTMGLTCGFHKEDFPELLKIYEDHRKKLKKWTPKEEWGWIHPGPWPKAPKESLAQDPKGENSKEESSPFHKDSSFPLDHFILGCQEGGISMVEVQGQECSEDLLFCLLVGGFYRLQPLLDAMGVFGTSLCLLASTHKNNDLWKDRHGHLDFSAHEPQLSISHESLAPSGPSTPSSSLFFSPEIFAEKQKILEDFLGDMLKPSLDLLEKEGLEEESYGDYVDYVYHIGLKKAKQYQKDLLDHKTTSLSPKDKKRKNFLQHHSWSKEDIHEAVISLVQQHLLAFVVKSQRRLNGRGFQERRPISCTKGFLPKAFGSALFTRGVTQALVTATLGAKEEGGYLDDIRGSQKENILFHYNFPPFAAGEVGKTNAVSRREIGHGRLALKAITPVISKDFPFTLRLVSEILGSSGSSSMASVCGATLALYDAGLALKNPVAGISMGLFRQGKKDILLTDISALEDNLGSMDFKIARTPQGITAIQMDSKDQGLSLEQVYGVLMKGKEVVLGLLEDMALFSPFVPQVSSLKESHQPSFHQLTLSSEQHQELGKKDTKGLKDFFKNTKAKVDYSSKGLLSVLCPKAKSFEDVQSLLKSLDSSGEKIQKEGEEKNSSSLFLQESSSSGEGASSSKTSQKKKPSSSNSKVSQGNKKKKTSSPQGEDNMEKPQPLGGQIYEGVVTEVLDKEARISFGFDEDGFLPLGEIADYPVKNLSSILEKGDSLRLRFLDYVPKRGYRLSLKQV